MKKILITLLVLIVISPGAFAQEKSSKEKKGDKFFTIYEYDDAIGKYKRTKDLTVSGQRNLAESYCIMEQYDESEETYAALINDGNQLISEDYYNYAMVLKKSGKYTESDVQMTKFSNQQPNDLRAISFRENRNQFNALSKDNGNFKIREMDINTDSQDFGTSYYKDQVVYASSNAAPKMIKRRDNRNNEPFFNLYVADVEEGQLKNREFFDKKENGKMHDGPATFSNSGTYMAYTKNVSSDKSKDKIVELRIFTRTLENDEWSDPVAFEHNNVGYSVGQPHLLADGKTMYFTSDMPGGFGGTDLYRSTRAGDGSWGAPENLGNVINTEGDEMFPFLDESRKTLYFASNGHYGLGGLDVFSSPMNGSAWGKVTNAGAPLNTIKDDYAFISDNKTNKGYFSSNRENGSGMDDIYGVDLLNVASNAKMIAGIATDIDDNPVAGTKVKLFDEEGNEIGEDTVDDSGAYTFSVESNKNYMLTGNKQDFIEANSYASTFGNDEIVNADLRLLKDEDGENGEEEVDVAEENIVVNEDIGAVIKMKPIYFDFDKSDITPKAAKELDKMIKVMNKFPKMEVQLTSYTDCRGPSYYNSSLSQARASSSAEYIKQRISTPKRISGKGAGESKTVNDCACEGDVISTCSEQEHQLNRRTEFIVTKK